MRFATRYDKLVANYLASQLAIVSAIMTMELNEWFNRLASGKGLCCSFADGSVVSDVDWELKDGHYRVRLEGRWIDVPDDAVITEPNRAGRTMVWPTRPIAGPIIRILKSGAFAGHHGLGRGASVPRLIALTYRESEPE